MATANTDPASMNASMARKVKFTTTNLDFATLFDESHVVTGPTSSAAVPLNSLNIGSGKVVVPLTNDTAQGANYIKFHFPKFFLNTGTESTFYITFCQKNNTMADGYYDFQTGVPDDYITDFRTFVNDGAQSNANFPVSKVKRLFFAVYGADTNQTSLAKQFTTSFTATIGGNQDGEGDVRSTN